MAKIYNGVIYGAYSQYTRLRINYTVSQDEVTAISTITMNLYAERTKGSEQYNNSGAAYWSMTGTGNNYMKFTWSSNSMEYHLGSSSAVVQHKPDGTGSITLNGYWYTGRTGSNYIPEAISVSEHIKLEPIARYSEINSFSVQSMGLTNAVIQYSVSRTANIYCSVDGMAWGDPRVWNTTSGTFTIPGLSPNAQHSFVILVRAVDSGLDRISGTIYGSTLNIGTITSAPDINFGDTAAIVKNNPSGVRNDLRIEILNPTTTIVTRLQIPNNYTLSLTDDEWDTLYKKLGGSNSITIRYVIDTIDGNNTYYHWVDRTLTLKGNQKTIRTNVKNEWKRGKLWTNVNGTWKRGVLWTNVSGTWKRGI